MSVELEMSEKSRSRVIRISWGDEQDVSGLANIRTAADVVYQSL